MNIKFGNRFWIWQRDEFAEEGTFFANKFPSMRTFTNKKVRI